MTYRDFVRAIAREAGVAIKDVDNVLDALASALQTGLRVGEKITLTGIGTFKVAERAARQVRNPRTGEIMMSEDCKAVKFSASKALKEAINK